MVGASLVCRAWQRAETAYPMQHTQLNTEIYETLRSRYSVHLDRFRWDLRDTSRLLRLELGSSYVDKFLTLQPQLSRLQYLKMGDLDYNEEQAGQLLHLSSLRNLQVIHCLSALAETLSLHFFYVTSEKVERAAHICLHNPV